MRRLLLDYASRKHRPSLSMAAAAIVGSCWLSSQDTASTSSNVRLEENDDDARNNDADPTQAETPWTRMWKAAAEDSSILQDIDESLPNRFTQFLYGDSKQKRSQAVTDILANIRDRSGNEQGVVEDTASFSSLLETLSLLDQYREDLSAVVSKYLSDDVLSHLVAPAFFYFLEAQDSIKTPSWKRRTHRFCRGVRELEMDKLNQALELAFLSYADTRQEIIDTLTDQGYNVIHCGTKSEPGKPAHFLAIRNEDSKPHVILVVRGSKTTADTITDLLCDPVEYRGGKAHSFILESGLYIAKKHKAVLRKLAREVGTLEVRIVGHSLGAGAATIAGLELNDDPHLQVNVVGFGGPALLSQDLAVSAAAFVTTIVNDDDVVPRLSGATLANLLLDISEFDWIPYAQNDIDFALDDQATVIGSQASDAIKDLISTNAASLLASLRNPTAEGSCSKEHLELELFPPGKCIHFYRDGVGVTGCVVPNTFFSEIDVSRAMLTGQLAQILRSLLTSRFARSSFPYWVQENSSGGGAATYGGPLLQLSN